MNKLFDIIQAIWKKRGAKKDKAELSAVYLDYRKARKIAPEDLMKALKKHEKISADKEIRADELVEIFMTTDNFMSIGLSIYLLSRSGVTTEGGQDRLLNLIKHEEELVRRMAAIRLTEYGTVEALSAVVAGNEHGHAIRTEAAWRLKEMGESAIAAIPSLIKLLRYKDINYRTHNAAYCALAAMGEDARKLMIALLEDEDETMQEHAAMTLEMMNPSAETKMKIVAILLRRNE